MISVVTALKTATGDYFHVDDKVEVSSTVSGVVSTAVGNLDEIDSSGKFIKVDVSNVFDSNIVLVQIPTITSIVTYTP